jgi:hypothetical protein
VVILAPSCEAAFSHDFCPTFLAVVNDLLAGFIAFDFIVMVDLGIEP